MKHEVSSFLHKHTNNELPPFLKPRNFHLLDAINSAHHKQQLNFKETNEILQMPQIDKTLNRSVQLVKNTEEHKTMSKLTSSLKKREKGVVNQYKIPQKHEQENEETPKSLKINPVKKKLIVPSLCLSTFSDQNEKTIERELFYEDTTIYEQQCKKNPQNNVAKAKFNVI